MEVQKFPTWPVLVVDDEIEAMKGCEFILRSAGISNTMLCQDSRDVMPFLEDHETCAVLLDLSMPHISGEELLPKIIERHPHVPVIILTGANEVETAVRCMRTGAFDYMVKPVEESRLVSGVERAVELSELRQEYSSFKSRVIANVLERPEAFSEIVTNNQTMRSIFQYVETIARTNQPVLLTGETGTGKELIAKALHTLSNRTGSFIAANVAGLDDQLFADTLFGHVKGAYTGAEEARPGLIAQASGGTLFLDEIGDLSFPSQVKLLRLLQEREYFPLGADVPKRTDARILVATNRDLKELRASDRFRADLYYRLQTHHVNLPPLRERRDDLPVLIDWFLEKTSKMLGKKKPTPPKELPALLGSYHFPGNVRELESMIFDAVSLHRSRVLSLDLFRARIQENLASEAGRSGIDLEGASVSPFAHLDKLPTLKEAQKFLLREAMKRAKGKQTVAAMLLGISQSGLSKALKREKEEGVSEQSSH